MAMRRVVAAFTLLITILLVVAPPGGTLSNVAQGTVVAPGAPGPVAGTPVAVPTQQPAPPVLSAAQQTLVQQLKTQAGGRLRISFHAVTGQVRFLGADPAQPIKGSQPLLPGAAPETVARAFLADYGSVFGLTDQGRELTVMRSESLSDGRSFVHFQQTVGNVPVMGGELIVQVGSGQGIISANGELLPHAKAAATPRIAAGDARSRALQAVAKADGLALTDLSASEPALWIYDPALLGAPGAQLAQLVWRVEVRAASRSDVDELVLVDALHGGVTLHFNQVETSLDRRIYDNVNDPSAGLPGKGPVRTEGQGATGIAEVDKAYDYAGDVYNYYQNNFGRDSLDGMGMPMIVTVRYCDPSSSCPYANAFWNGQQMAFGQGFVTDDVMGHEMTHGVTDHESHLFYFMQSGAINESLSDIFGEFIDQTNGRGNDDPSVKWLIGEDLPIGAIRSMSNPPLYGQPDRMTSSYWDCADWATDNGGVHNNSGVGNKAAYLMVEGGTFNGHTVTGLGLTKTAKIWYEAATNLLTSGADYSDLSDSLIQACTDLVGTSGITSADCTQVENVVAATEMNQQPLLCAEPEAPVCSAIQTVNNVWFDNLEDPANSQWTVGTLAGSNIWFYPQNPNPYSDWDPTYATSGVYNMWGDDAGITTDGYIAMKTGVTLPANAYLHFNHAYLFEQGYDGGVVEYSLDGSSTWQDAGNLFTDGGYTGTLGGVSPLAGRRAFTGYTYGYVSSRLNLSSLAGHSVRFRFRISTDSSIGGLGWFIDDVRIYTCETPAGLPGAFLPLVMRVVPTPTPTPTPRLGINGRLTYHGSAASGLKLSLVRYDGANTYLVAATVTGSDGRYNFAGVPSLPAGQEYYVEYDNTPSDPNPGPGYLYSWYGNRITTYTAGATAAGGDFDVADIPLVSPAYGAYVTLPAWFSWTSRGISGDNYRLFFYYPAGYSVAASNYLGGSTSFYLGGLPAGWPSGSGYFWWVDVFRGSNPDSTPYNYGTSYGTGWVTIYYSAGALQGASASGSSLAPAPRELERMGIGRAASAPH